MTGLEPNAEYTFRVCPVRITDSGDDHFGSYSPATRQRTAAPQSTIFPEGLNGRSAENADTVDAPLTTGGHTCSSVPAHHELAGSRSVVQRLSGKWALLMYNRKKMSDQDRAVVYSVCFLGGTILIACIIRIVLQQALG